MKASGWAVLLVASTAFGNAAPRPQFAKPQPCAAVNALLEEGKLAEAQQKLDGWSAPKEACYFLARGELYRLKNDFGKAEAEIKQALAVDPKLTAVRAEHGAMLLELGRPEEAAAELRRATTEDAQIPDAWFNLATAEVRLGHCKEAGAAAKTATDKAPKDAATWILRSEAELCSDTDAAAAAARRAIELAPKDAAAYVALGGALKHGKKHDEAVAALQKAVALDGSAQNLVELGRALGSAGKRAEAEAQFQKALAKDPKSAVARLLFAQELAHQKKCGDMEKALRPLDGDARHQGTVEKLRAACAKK